MTPEIFWVVSDGTNVGKTTIASALIRALNKLGRRAVGFKPFAGIYLYESIDFILNDYPRSKCTLYGADVLKMSNSSPLTTDEMLEILGPFQYLMFPRFPHFLMLRTGAKLLNNVEYFITQRMEMVKERIDFKRIIEKTSLPIKEAILIDERLIHRRDPMSENKCGASFEFVKALGADAVVFEGAGRFLPVWKGNPIVNHAFIIHSGHVRYIPDINIDPEVYVHKINAPTTGDLAKSVLDFTRRGFVEPLYLVESFSVDDMAEQIVTTLLQKGRE